MKNFEIHAGNLEALEKKVAKANRRAERAGIEARFAFEVTGEKVVEKKDGQGVPTGEVEVYKTIEMDYPEVKMAGWDFLAAVQFEEGGTIIRNHPDKELPEGFERPDAHNCDHCNVNRNRKNTYIVQNDSGETAQVGSTCIQDFLGIEPKGLWMLEAFTPEEIEEWGNVPTGGNGWTPTMLSLDTVIRVAMVVSENGAKFVSKKRAIEQESSATSEDVVNIVVPNKHLPEHVQQAHREVLEQAHNLPSDLIEEVHQAVEDMADSDYALNMRAVLGSQSITFRSVGFAASAAAVYNRAHSEKVEREVAKKAEGFVADVKVRFRNVPVTVTKVIWWENQWGMTAMNLFRTEDGKIIKWVTGAVDLEVGDEVLLTATVKEWDNYNGDDQTVVSRGIVKVAE